MALRSVRFFQIFSFTILLFLLLFPSINVQAMTGQTGNRRLPSLSAFVRQVSNGQASELRGVYIPGILAAPIVRQPAGMEDFVSPHQNIITQYSLASRLGSTGLLAHNYLAGKTFALLQVGQEIDVVYGDGKISTFTVTEILQYQAMEPGSISSIFVDLNTHTPVPSSSLFTQVYNRPGQVIFQTCIQSGDDTTWGRLFVIAEPSG